MLETKTLPMLRAVNDVILAVRDYHEGIPEVVVVLGYSGKKKGSQTHGHFAPKAWVGRDGDARTHELFLSGESLSRGGKDTLGTIIHELAHAYCHANGINDTSNRGRYHNKQFKEIAESFGLEIGHSKTIGHSPTTVPDYTAQRYSAHIDALDEVLEVYRDQFQIAASVTAKKFLMQCPDCKDPVPTGKKWFERNRDALRCDFHEVPFELIEEG